MSDTKPTLYVKLRTCEGCTIDLPRCIAGIRDGFLKCCPDCRHDRPATLADVVVGLLEHIKCDRCVGLGYTREWDEDVPGDGLTSQRTCPDCVGGYQIPDEWVNRVADAVYSRRHGPSMSGPHPTTKDVETAYDAIVALLEEMRADK